MKLLFQHVHAINRALPVLLIFVIPVSTALTNIVLGVLCLFWILDNRTDRFASWLGMFRSNPVALMGAAVFLMHLLGMVYTAGETAKIGESLSDGARFLFISMMMLYFRDDTIRRAFFVFIHGCHGNDSGAVLFVVPGSFTGIDSRVGGQPELRHFS